MAGLRLAGSRIRVTIGPMNRKQFDRMRLERAAATRAICTSVKAKHAVAAMGPALQAAVDCVRRFGAMMKDYGDFHELRTRKDWEKHLDGPAQGEGGMPGMEVE